MKSENSEELRRHRTVEFPLSSKTIQTLQIGDVIENVPLSKLAELVDTFEVDFYKTWAVRDLLQANLEVIDIVNVDEHIEFDVRVKLPQLPDAQALDDTYTMLTIGSEYLESSFSKGIGKLKKLLRK